MITTPIQLNDNYIINNQRLEEVYRIVDELISSMDDEVLKQMYSGYETDVDNLINIIEEETFRALYGDGKKIIPSFNYLEKLTENFEETLRIENFLYFITSTLTDFEINWHHIEWTEIAQYRKYFDVVAARDHGKSFMFSNAFPIWKMYRYKKNNGFERVRPDLNCRFTMLFSFSLGQAKDLLTILKETIEGNEILYKRLFPSNTKDGWAAESIRCKNGAYLKVKGFGSSVRGAHPHTIIVDDPHKDNIIYSSVQRKKASNYFHSVIMNAIVPGGQVGVVGTPFHTSDLHGDLKSKMKIDPNGKVDGWYYREYPALFPDGRLLWENRYNYKTLIEKRETQGSLIFSREQLCRPIISESSIFPYELIQRAFIRMENYTLVNNIESFPIKFTKVVMGCDFALSANVGADFSCYITLGIDDEDNHWLLNVTHVKGKGFDEQLMIIRQLHNNFKHDLILMESNIFQSIFPQQADKMGLPVMEHQTGTNKNDFRKGLPGLAIIFERSKFKFPRGDQNSIDKTDLIALELSSIAFTEKGLQSVGEHDDTSMSLWLATKAKHYVDNDFKFTFL